MNINLKEKAQRVVMRLIRKAISNVDKQVDLTKLRAKYKKNQLKLFAINLTDINYSAVVDTTHDKLELVGEGEVSNYEEYPMVNMVVNLETSTFFDIIEGVSDPLKMYLLGKIKVSKVNEDTFAADMKIVNEVFFLLKDTVPR